MDDLISGRAKPILLAVSDLGERFAIAVIGSTSEGVPFASAVTPRVLKCLPIDVANACQSFGLLVAADFMAWCGANRPVEAWTAPISGLQFGDWIEVDAYDVASMVQNVLSMCALHGNVPRETENQPAEIVTPRTSEESRFLELVRNEVTRRRPTLKAGFRKAFSLTGKEIGGEIDFVGSRYATCYSAINPKGRPALRIQTACAALWRLARARDAFGFAAPSLFELTAWIPPRGQPIFSDREYFAVDETIAELTAEARKEDLGVFTATGPSIAGDRLISLEKHDDLPS